MRAIFFQFFINPRFGGTAPEAHVRCPTIVRNQTGQGSFGERDFRCLTSSPHGNGTRAQSNPRRQAIFRNSPDWVIIAAKLAVLVWQVCVRNPDRYGLVAAPDLSHGSLPERPQGDAIELGRFQCDFFCEPGLVTLGDFVFNRARNPRRRPCFRRPENIQFKRPNSFFESALNT
jgi:hypothetical protein